MAIYNNVNGTIFETNHKYENVNGSIFEVNAKYQNVNGYIYQTYSSQQQILIIKDGIIQVDDINKYIKIQSFHSTIDTSESYISQASNYVNIRAVSNHYLQNGGADVHIFLALADFFKITGNALAYYNRPYNSNSATGTGIAFGTQISDTGNGYHLIYGYISGGTAPSSYLPKTVDYNSESQTTPGMIAQAVEVRNSGSGVTGVSRIELAVRIYGDVYLIKN